MASIEDKVYKYIISHGGRIVASECATELDVSVETVKNAMQALRESGKLKKPAPKNVHETKTVSSSVPPAMTTPDIQYTSSPITPGVNSKELLFAEIQLIKEDLDKLPAKVATGVMTITEYESRRAILSQRLNNINKELEILLTQPKSFQTASKPPLTTVPSIKLEAITDLIEERNKVATWLHNLDAKTGTISEEAYKQVKEDYEKRLSAIQSSLKPSLGGLIILLNENKTKKEKISTELSNLEARHMAGEFDDRYYETQKTDRVTKFHQLTVDIAKIEEFINQIG